MKDDKLDTLIRWLWILVVLYATFHFGRFVGRDEGENQQISHYRLHREMAKQTTKEER